ncbi:AAA family ATPase [Bacillus thuringiensis]|uniref:AAA family ATPase n=1 Tax=Bacillus thuringiensis TaxID=1428 RepID=UPI000BF59208|nr:AAA family ATPase [Bacillus thuringiensis]PFJ57019.1 chromosome segregation protein SMC [Bacillus thuringiensis]
MIRIYKEKYFDSIYDDFLENVEIQKENYISSELITEFMIKYFNGKCSYCEIRMEVLPLEIDFYRPINGSLNTVDGQFYPDHYKWLKNQDENILSICVECKRAKSNRFPVEGAVAAVNSYDSWLWKERRLLVQPCRDYPEKNFVYDKSGMIYSRNKRGQVTIDALNLNRNMLMEMRAQAYSEFSNLCYIFSLNQNSDALDKILEEIDSDSIFAGIKRFRLFELVILNDQIPYVKEFEPFFRNIMPKNQLEIFSPRHNNDNYNGNNNTGILNRYVKKTKDYFFRETNNDYYDVTNENELYKYFGKQRFIEKIEIHNFKSIRNMKIDFTLSKSSDAPWLMLLGENGVGKSSILQAIALTLMGKEQREKIIKKKPYEYLTKGSNEGSIKVQLSGMLEPIIIYFNSSSLEFTGENHQRPRVLILGYGSTRLLPREDMISNHEVTWARAENLFNPFVPLVNVREYLLSLNDEEFNNVKKAIESLFLEKVIIDRDQIYKEVYFVFANSYSTLEDLSDGYQTIIALATDIMMVMKNRWRNFDAEGIVLIDEIDAHLHPRWNIKIVSRLKRAFPKVQFISTTHNPLSLRGLIDGEIAVLLENEDREVCIVQNLPNQKEFNVEGLLTSRFFGLYDTIPELDGMFDRYYQLLSNPNPNAEQEEEIERLKNELSKYEKLGNTLREQKFYEVVDKYLANSRKKNLNLDEKDFDNIIKDAIDYFER